MKPVDDDMRSRQVPPVESEDGPALLGEPVVAILLCEDCLPWLRTVLVFAVELGDHLGKVGKQEVGAGDASTVFVEDRLIGQRSRHCLQDQSRSTFADTVAPCTHRADCTSSASGTASVLRCIARSFEFADCGEAVAQCPITETHRNLEWMSPGDVDDCARWACDTHTVEMKPLVVQ